MQNPQFPLGLLLRVATLSKDRTWVVEGLLRQGKYRDEHTVN